MAEPYLLDKVINDVHVFELLEERGRKNIVAHHINSFNWDIENRANPDNGITLCKNCHKDFHDIYGYGDNDKKQFKEWLDGRKN
jgi:hypothetical protein